MATTTREIVDTVVGECELMCSEKEAGLRKTHNLVNYYEFGENLFESNNDCHEEFYLVKEFVRSSADQARPLPQELRTPAALVRTMSHLCGWVVNHPPSDPLQQTVWYDFLFNRFRAIIKDITQQRLEGVQICKILETMGRFYIYCHGYLDDVEVESFSRKANLSALASCIEMINQFNNNIATFGAKPLSAVIEFKMYEIMMNFETDIEFVSVLSCLPSYLVLTEPLYWTISLCNFHRKNMSLEFFSLLTSKFPFLCKCLLSGRSSELRKLYVDKLSRVYTTPNQNYKSVPLMSLKESLGITASNKIDRFLELTGSTLVEQGLKQMVQIPNHSLNYASSLGTVDRDAIRQTTGEIDLARIIQSVAFFEKSSEINTSIFEHYDFCVSSAVAEEALMKLVSPAYHAHGPRLFTFNPIDKEGYPETCLGKLFKDAITELGISVDYTTPIVSPLPSLPPLEKFVPHQANVDASAVAIDIRGNTRSKNDLLKETGVLIQLLESKKGNTIMDANNNYFSLLNFLVNPHIVFKVKGQLNSKTHGTSIFFKGSQLPIWQFSKNPFLSHCIRFAVKPIPSYPVIIDSFGRLFPINQFLFDTITTRALSKKSSNKYEGPRQQLFDIEGRAINWESLLRDQQIIESLKASRHGTVAFDNYNNPHCVSKLLMDVRFRNYFTKCKNIRKMLIDSDRPFVDSCNNHFPAKQFLLNAYLLNSIVTFASGPVVFASNNSCYLLEQFLFHPGVAEFLELDNEKNQSTVPDGAFSGTGASIGEFEESSVSTEISETQEPCNMSEPIEPFAENTSQFGFSQHPPPSSFSVNKSMTSPFSLPPDISAQNTSSSDVLPTISQTPNSLVVNSQPWSTQEAQSQKCDTFSPLKESSTMNPFSSSHSVSNIFTASPKKELDSHVDIIKSDNATSVNLPSFSVPCTPKSDINIKAHTETNLVTDTVKSLNAPLKSEEDLFLPNASFDHIKAMFAELSVSARAYSKQLGFSRTEIANHKRSEDMLNLQNKEHQDFIKLKIEEVGERISQLVTMTVVHNIVHQVCHKVFHRLMYKKSKKHHKRKRLNYILNDSKDDVDNDKRDIQQFFFKRSFTEISYKQYNVQLSEQHMNKIQTALPWCKCLVVFDCFVLTPIVSLSRPNMSTIMHTLYTKLFHPKAMEIDDALRADYSPTSINHVGMVMPGDDVQGTRIKFDLAKEIEPSPEDKESFPQLYPISLQPLHVYDLLEQNEATCNLAQNCTSVVFVLSSNSNSRVEQFCDETKRTFRQLVTSQYVGKYSSAEVFRVIVGGSFDSSPSVSDQNTLYVDCKSSTDDSLHRVAERIIEWTCNHPCWMPACTQVDAGFICVDFERNIMQPLHKVALKYDGVWEWEDAFSQLVRDAFNSYLKFLHSTAKSFLSEPAIPTSDPFFECFREVFSNQMPTLNHISFILRFCANLESLAIPQLSFVTSSTSQDCQCALETLFSHYNALIKQIPQIPPLKPLSLRDDMVSVAECSSLSNHKFFSVNHALFLQSLFPYFLDWAVKDSLESIRHPNDCSTNCITLPFYIVSEISSRKWAKDFVRVFETCPSYFSLKKTSVLSPTTNSKLKKKLVDVQNTSKLIDIELENILSPFKYL